MYKLYRALYTGINSSLEMGGESCCAETIKWEMEKAKIAWHSHMHTRYHIW